MRALYRLLLSLYPRQIRREFGDEMLDVFDQANAEARQNGFVSYLRFCLRELAGLFVSIVVREQLVRHRRWMIQGGIAGLLLAGVAAAAIASRPYISTATLRLLPQVIPERLVAPQTSQTPELALQRLSEVVTARSSLATMIVAYGMYADKQKVMPVEDVIEEMRKDIIIESRGDRMLGVSFRYPDRMLAQKVTADLVSRVMTEYTRERTTQSSLTAQFMKEQVDLAAIEWEEAMSRLQEAEKSGKSTARARLDTDIARQRYEATSARHAESRMTESMEKRQQGAVLELLDPASLPADDHPNVYVWVAWGALGGSILGWLVSTLLAMRRSAVIRQAEI
ncbi:MAG: hypothetical protein SGI92_15545 [Bryobacteraceae bacterium]|nr:hypothetical protein [Bryobacteraceae bacterium]